MSFRFFLLTVAPPLLGVGLGYLLGGRRAGFRTVRIRALWLVWLAALVQFAQYSLAGVRHVVEDVAGLPMLALVFAIVLGWLAINLGGWPGAIRAAGLAIVLGAVLNGVVIAANGRMPYDPVAVAKVSERDGLETPKNEPAGPGTRLAWLGDTIPIPGLRKVASPGDVLISVGACAFVVLVMRRRPEEAASTEEAVTRTAEPKGANP
ncbi:DUF5317 family protein [Asanoa sp. NPDC050611]|uniref:DUF5317 family protein n=1 Tax=Asanoa sp. NPDC050611 TaxID=3157098 RepID=UPI00340F9F5C